jgi:hypothetical protein
MIITITSSAPASGAADDALVVGTWMTVDAKVCLSHDAKIPARGRTEQQPGRLRSPNKIL